jgi:cytochrome c2
VPAAQACAIKYIAHAPRERGPQEFIPGNVMPFSGVLERGVDHADGAECGSLIAYLRTLI